MDKVPGFLKRLGPLQSGNLEKFGVFLFNVELSWLKVPEITLMFTASIFPTSMANLCGYLECNGFKGICAKYNVPPSATEMNWFWGLCSQTLEITRSLVLNSTNLKLAFAPAIAQILLSHHSGAKTVSSEMISIFKSKLGQAGFEAEFKCNFLRIIAYCALFKTKLRLQDTGIIVPF